MKVYIFLIILGLNISGFCQDSLITSKAHHVRNGFKNPYPGFEEHDFKNTAKWLVWDKFINDTNKEDIDSVRFEPAGNDPQWLKNNKSVFAITWIGHSTLLIQLDGLNILTDPVWAERVSPLNFIGPKRVVPAGLKIKDLPQIDVVIITHNHYDHLDTDTIEKLGNRPLYLIPLGLAPYLKDLDISNYQELDWQEEIKFNNVKFVCSPAQHFSGRNLFDRDKTLWCSWIINGTKKIYIAGDSGYFPGFKEVGKKYGPFDVAAIPIGAYEPRWFMHSVQIDPSEAVDVYTDIKAKYFLPIHWGTFQLGDEPLKEPPKILMSEVKKRKMDENLIRVLKHGETFIFPGLKSTESFNVSED